MNTENERVNFNQGKFLVYDSETMPYKDLNAFAHFALTDALIANVGKNEQPILHFWQTAPLAILGMMDTKIGHFEKALKIFDAYQHDYIVRNSGGLAVVGDPGVLNVSLIYPSNDQRLSIDKGYEFMLEFIRQTFYPYFSDKIDAYEIPTSYCFGDYDLSINGQKIAGISQRRIKNGVAVMLYISVNGNQKKRAQMLKDFYELGLDGSERPGRYPNINPDIMTTLTDAYQTDLTVPKVKEMMLEHFNWTKGQYTKEIDQDFEDALEKMISRNARVFGQEFIEKRIHGRSI